MKSNQKKIAFIICTNNKQIMSETEKYINSLELPEGMEEEIIMITDARSMTEGYNRAMRSSDAKYKVYMHQDVFLINKNLISDCIEIFNSNPKVGLLGIIGCEQLPENAIWWEGIGCKGRTLEDNLQCLKELNLGEVKEVWEPVQAVDGQLIITQYDVQWREDICQGWHFYDTSQCLEFVRKGYEVGVARQESPWVIHECGMDINIGYEAERLMFLEEYKRDIGKNDADWEEVISGLVNEGDWIQARKEIEQYKNTGNKYSDVIAILEASICFAEGKKEEAYFCISKGLVFNHQNYELYYMLGNYYLNQNKNQAFLCYENAEFYCKTEDKGYLSEVKNTLLDSGEVTVNPVSIIILSYNGREMTSLCVDSLRQTMPPEAYEIVIVDNASSDDSVEWLQSEEKTWARKVGINNFKVLYNKENKGFPGGCNQGISISEKQNDIFLLNNDTVVPPNAVFWLRMGLYEDDKVGAVGSVSNHANNDQMIKEKLSSIEAYYEYGIKNNIPMKYPYEKKAWLMGFAVMFKREALEQVGYLDERFTPGNYEDNDIGFRFLEKGYTQFLCKNSFIYHFGSVGFRKNQKAFDELLSRNRKKLAEKHGLPIDEYSWVRTDLLDLIKEETDSKLMILDVGCGLGATMAKAESLFVNSTVVGIEKNEKMAGIGKNIANIYHGDIETMKLPFERSSFDYIICGNVLEYLDTHQKVLEKLSEFLKDSGCFIISISKVVKRAERIVPITKVQVEKELEVIKGSEIDIFQEDKNDYIIKLRKKIR